MKKKLALLMAGTMAVASLVGCGGEKAAETTAAAAATTTAAAKAEAAPAGDAAPAGGDVAMTMYWWGNQVRNERTEAALALYEQKNPGVSVDPQFAPWADYWTKLATLAAGKAVPDVLQMDYMYVTQYAQSGALVDLTPYIESGALDCSKISENTMASGMVDGGIYAICAGINSPSLFYNKTLTDSLGIEIKDYMTMDEFYAISKEINEKSGYKTDLTYGTANSWSEYFMRGYDVVPMSAGQMNATWEAWIPFFEAYEKGIEEGWYLDPSVFAELTIGAVENFPLVYGSSPETMTWCYLANSNQYAAVLAAAPEGMEIGMTTWPSADPTKSGYLKSSQFFSIGADTKNVDAAVALLNFLINDYEANEILLGERGVPAPSDVAEHIATLVDENEQKVIGFINNVVTPNCSPINPPQPDGANEVYDVLNRTIEEVCYQQLNAEEAAKKFFEEASKIMATKK